ncbi:MAG: DUF3060 domain-containing protein [Pyrinomonadaceae bacterium]|nr:DUF3060 domain-containing protein [Blastocatellia bacterium]MCW5958267.1 DUF3060 domain-containing protein [Pyrinomonadaceae bacterium]
MKTFALLTALTICFYTTGCEVQSDITKKSLEKFQPTPTPEKVPVVEEPIDPADVVTADTAVQGPQIFISRATDKKKINCDKYNRVMVNGNDHVVEIKGACSQLMVNGNNNQVTLNAASEIITNGTSNTVQYSKYVNGKKPTITDNSRVNTITKSDTAASATPAK